MCGLYPLSLSACVTSAFVFVSASHDPIPMQSDLTLSDQTLSHPTQSVPGTILNPFKIRQWENSASCNVCALKQCAPNLTLMWPCNCNCNCVYEEAEGVSTEGRCRDNKAVYWCSQYFSEAIFREIWVMLQNFPTCEIFAEAKFFRYLLCEISSIKFS